MIWWKRDIGAWRAKTAHLTPLEKGVYVELLDHYYATETPLPPDSASCWRIAGAKSAMETNAVDKILTTLFEKTPDGFVNKRAEAEIAKYLAKHENKSVSATEAWAKRKAAR
ncbi:MAG: YdaU family protein [Sulfuricaulis sp.]|nr:YdaU family protein [Sulfuricaulis sp.]